MGQGRAGRDGAAPDAARRAMLSLVSPTRTWAHRWPAGTKLAALCAATVILLALDALWPLLVASAATLALFLAGGARFARAGLGRLRALWPFVVVLVAWNAWEGQAREGIVLSLRLLSAVGLATLVTMTTPLTETMNVVRRLATPLRRFGIGTRPAEIALALVLRHVPMLTHRGARLAEAWRARSGGRRASWRIVVPLVAGALDDAEHVADALRARGGLLEGDDAHGT